MSYTALYRSWRPQTFSQLVGQEHISRTLRNALAQGKVAHGYIFCGPRGTGKTSTARILAKSINCHAPQGGEPCNQCPSCRRISAGSSMDVIEIDAASNRGIDEMRDLREKVRLAPAQERYKVYIIDEVHMLTTEAFNAFLKTLEEPPQHVIFILATTEPQKVPATILSRCQRFDFRRLGLGAIRSRLQEIAEASGRNITEGALRVLARAAGGSLRDGLSMLDQCLAYVGDGPSETLDEDQVTEVLGMLDEQRLLALGQALAESDGARVLEILDEATEAGKDPRQMAKDMVTYFRFLLQLNLTDKKRSGSPGAFREQARLFSPDRLIAIMRAVSTAESEMRWSAQPQVILEVALIGCCHPAQGANADLGMGPGTGAVAGLDVSAGPGARPLPLVSLEHIRALEKRVEALEQALAGAGLQTGRPPRPPVDRGAQAASHQEARVKPSPGAAAEETAATATAPVGAATMPVAGAPSSVTAAPTPAAATPTPGVGVETAAGASPPRLPETVAPQADAVTTPAPAISTTTTRATTQTGAGAGAGTAGPEVLAEVPDSAASQAQPPASLEDLRSRWPELIAALEQDEKMRRGLMAVLETSEPLEYRAEVARIGYRGGGALAGDWLEERDFRSALRQAWSQVWGERAVPQRFVFERLAEAAEVTGTAPEGGSRAMPSRRGASQRHQEDVWLEEAQRMLGGTIVSWPPKGWKPVEKP